jgi:RNA polymerase sigma-70 factor (ECF subfamily)
MSIFGKRCDKPLEEIIRALQEGRDTRDNFRILFERFYAPVYQLFKHKGMTPEDASDLSQEVFLAVYRGLGELRDAAQFPGWLFTVARNIFYGELDRRHARKRSLPPLPWPSLEEPLDLDQLPAAASEKNAISDLLDRERIQKLREALRRLPDQMRRCVELRVSEDSSYEEIGAVLGISSNTVKVHLHRARKELRSMLGQYFQSARTRTATRTTTGGVASI